MYELESFDDLDVDALWMAFTRGEKTSIPHDKLTIEIEYGYEGSYYRNLFKVNSLVFLTLSRNETTHVVSFDINDDLFTEEQSLDLLNYILTNKSIVANKDKTDTIKNIMKLL